MTGQRARDDHARLGRRRQLLDAAAGRFDAAGYAATTMAEVATEAGLAKGTTYLYFRSKEELFLELLLEALEEWEAAARAHLTGAAAPDAAGLALALAGTLAERPRLVRLLALTASVLEPGAGAATAERFRVRQEERLEVLAARLEGAYPALGAGGGSATIARLLALAAGFSRSLEFRASPNEAMREATHGRSFAAELSSALELLFRAASTPPRPPAP